MKYIGLIPARMDSTRLPGKPLIEICGVPMIHRTYDQARKSHYLSDLYVVTDSEKIRVYCENHNIPVLVVGSNDKITTGSDRVFQAAERYFPNSDYCFINIQGDEPIIDPSAIDYLISKFEQGLPIFGVATLKKRCSGEEARSRHVVKVVTSQRSNRLIYASRLPIPCNFRGSSEELGLDHWKQVPVYAFNMDSLKRFHLYGRDKSPLEQLESIEINRFLDIDLPVCVYECTYSSIAVDIMSDVAKVERVILANPGAYLK